LAIIVHDFKNGDAPETIQWNFPTLSLEQVYGSISFYLGNKEEVERIWSNAAGSRTSSSGHIQIPQDSSRNCWNDVNNCCRGAAEAWFASWLMPVFAARSSVDVGGGNPQ